MNLKRETKLLYDMFLRGISLTKENMYKNGLNDDDINLLISTNAIAFTKIDNLYKFNDVVKLRYYGIYLLSKGIIKDAITCFEMCYEIIPDNIEICIQFLLAKLNKKDYEEVIDAFRQLEEIKNSNSKTSNLILYLLNCIVKLPDEYEERLLKLDLDDLLFDDEEKYKKENELINAIWNSNFTYAYRLTNDMINSHTNYSVKEELIKELLKQVFEKNDNIMESIKRNIQNKNYEKIVDILRKVQVKRKLTYIETYIILIADAIVKVKETGIIPTIYKANCNELFDLLVSNNFKKAFKEGSKRNELIYILLVELNNLIDSLEKSNNIDPDVSYDNAIESAEGYIWQIKQNNMSIEEGISYYRLNFETSLLIRIINARDNCTPYSRKFYFESLRLRDDLTPNIIRLLDEIEGKNNQETITDIPKAIPKKKYRFRHFGKGQEGLRTKF